MGPELLSPPPGKPDAVGSSTCISPGSSGEGELDNQHIIPHQSMWNKMGIDSSSCLGTLTSMHPSISPMPCTPMAQGDTLLSDCSKQAFPFLQQVVLLSLD